MRPQAHGREPGADGALFDLSAFFPGAEALETRLANAWHGQAVASDGGNPVLVLVGG